MLYLYNSFDVKDLTKNTSLTKNGTYFSFPDTLGALFFGISLVVYYSTCKHIKRSELAKTRKALSYAFISLLLALGILGHAYEVYECSLNTQIYQRFWSTPDDNSLRAWGHMTGTRGHFVPALQSFIVVFTGWVAAHILAFRAYLLAGHIRWFGILLAALLYPMFLAQLILLSMGFTSAFPSYPIINLTLQIPITLAVLSHAYTGVSETKGDICHAIENVLVDSGAFLTVGLILQTVFPFVDVGFEPMMSLLPHLQNITVYLSLTRLIDGQGVNGLLRLLDEEEAGNVGASPSSLV